MHAYLFIPCLVEQLAPKIGLAAARVLSRAGISVTVPRGQTCCGQPLYKTGFAPKAAGLAKRFVRLFEEAEYVVAPSGSCVSMVRKYPELLAGEPEWAERAAALAPKVFELSQFLVDKAGATDLGASLTARAAYHDSCQVGRALGVREQPLALLQAVSGLELVELSRPEKCCGFGGSFSLEYPHLSESLADEKLSDALAAGAEVVVTAEVSCLLNLAGTIAKAGLTLRAMHLAEVLAGFETGEDAS